MGESGVGSPNWVLLHQFGRMISDMFGEYPYLVGSALKTTKWRDVDVRLILSDEDYLIQFGDPNASRPSRKLMLTNLFYSIAGQKLTGLPIDFQVQQQTDANKKFPGKRSSLILWGEFTEGK